MRYHPTLPTTSSLHLPCMHDMVPFYTIYFVRNGLTQQIISATTSRRLQLKHRDTMKAFSSTLLVFILCSLPAVSGRNVFQSLLDGFQKHKDGHHHLGNDRSAPSEDQRRRLLETGRKSTNVDLDAATGTVSHIVTPEEKAQKEKAKEAQTCDAQMALALVQANEKQEAAEKERDAALKEHAAAIDKIVNLQTLLTQLEGKLAVAATDLKETKETADRVLKETKQQAKEELENTQQKAQQDINAVKEGKAQALQQEKEQHRVELDNLKTEKDDIIVSLQKKLKMTSEELQRTLEEELEKARTDRDEKLAKLQTKMDAAVAELEADRDSKVAAAESDRDTKIANLKKKMETESRDATKLLQTTKDEAKAYMVTQVNAVKAELAQAKADHEKTLNEKNQKIKTLQQHAERVLEKKSSLEEELNAAREVSLNRCSLNLFSISFRLLQPFVRPFRNLITGELSTRHDPIAT